MAGKGFISRGRDVLDDIYQTVDELAERLTKHENIKTPTAPLYKFAAPDPGDLPDDPIEGQYAISHENEFWIYRNGAWHKVGGGQNPWIAGYIGMETSDWPDTGTNFPFSGLAGGVGSEVLLTDDFPSLNDRLASNGGIFLPVGSMWLIFAQLSIDVQSSFPALTSIAKFYANYKKANGIDAAEFNTVFPLEIAEHTGHQAGANRKWICNLLYMATIHVGIETDEALFFVNTSDSAFDTAGLALAELKWLAIRMTDWTP